LTANRKTVVKHLSNRSLILAAFGNVRGKRLASTAGGEHPRPQDVVEGRPLGAVKR